MNAAFNLLAHGHAVAEAAERLVANFGLSRRQAYRYLQEAQEIKRPVAVAVPTIPITIKMPQDVAAKLRAYAKVSGLTIGEVVARAISNLLTPERRRG